MRHFFTLFSILFLSSLTWAQCNLTYSIDSIPANCAGSCDGGITFSYANSGTNAAPYVAVVQNGLGANVDSWTFFNESDIYTFPNICAGNYTLTIQSVFTPACVYSTSIVVTEPTPLVISSVDLVHETSGLSNGEITINATGGVGPYLYSINNGATFQFSNHFTGLDAGTYYTVVQDANGCMVSEAVGVGLIVTTGCEIVASTTPQATSCAGVCDGEIVYEYENLQMISGAPYTVTIEDSDGTVIDVQTHFTQTQTIVFDNLCADTYTITLQGSTCSFIITGTVSTPDAMTVYLNSNNPTFGDANGTAELVVIGGVSPYTYSIDGGTVFQASPEFPNLAEGNYAGLVQDDNGCLWPLDFTLTDQTTCMVGISANTLDMPSCFGNCDGSISYSFNDANAHEVYHVALIQNDVTVQSATFNSASGSSTFTNLCAGVYEVVVTDVLNCSAIANVTVMQPAALNISGISTTNTDAGLDNGTATINATGGQAPYTYSVNGVSYFSSNLFTGLSAGLDTAYVEDANGCGTSFPFVIQKNSSCNFNISLTPDSISCSGMCDGNLSYQFNGSGSDTPFSIKLESNGNVIETAMSPSVTVTGNFSGLCSGIYVLTVGNSSGCEQIAVTAIQGPSPLEVVATTQTASTGNNDGAIFVNVSGGTAPFEYSINNQTTWQSSSAFNSLGAGFYTAWVKDANGCIGAYTLELEDTSSCPFVLDIFATEPTCVNYCDAKLTCTFLDLADNPPFVIQLFQGSTLIDSSPIFPSFSGLHQFTGLCEGGYIVKYIDADGCVDAQQVYIHGPDQIQVTVVDITNASAGESDGSAEIQVTGGTAPYEFTLDFGATWQNENAFNNLDPGVFITMIQDANGCFFLHSFAVNEEPGCNITTTFDLITPISCYDTCDAVIQYSFSEAVNTPPYVVELLTNTGVIETTTFTTNNFTGIWDTLCQGIFSMTVTNGNGCMALMPWLTITMPPNLYLDGLATDASTGQTNGVIELISSGGTGQHEYSIDDVIYQELPVFENMAPGSYLVYLTDGNDCRDTTNFVIGENAACNILLTTLADATVTCPGDCSGAISFDYDDANSNAPYSILLQNSNGEVLGSALGTSSNGTGLFTGLCAGDYEVMVTDASGCQSIASVASIAQPDYLAVDFDVTQPTNGYYNGSFTLNPSGGTPPYEYSTNNQITWSGANTWTNLAAGFYVIYVKDANGCVNVICYVLTEPWVAGAIELNADISVYPNPTEGVVFVNASNIQSALTFDLNGKYLELPTIVAANGIAFDFSSLADGMYVLEITTVSGDVLRTQVVKN